MPAGFDPSTSAGQTSARPRGRIWIAGGLIVLAAIAGYANTFAVPFLLDDRTAIAVNASIKDLTELGAVLTPTGLTIGGRPLVNLTFALNHAWSGDAVWSYHAVNLAIHLFAGLALFGVVRRTLQSAGCAEQFRAASLPLGFLVALLWTVHPLQTSAVTYLSQRAESLMGLCYLLTLYTFVRAATSASPNRWLGLSVTACCCGMLSKEVMVTAPGLVLLYDRVFCAPSFGAALAKRRWYYGALAASWVLLAYLMTSSHLATRNVGFQTLVSPWNYALTEFKVVVWYVKLAVWPSPLVFDYGPEMLVHDFLAALPYLLVVLAAIGFTVRLFARGRKELGFVAAAFFILLSPTSSFVPIAGQPMAESRMYLPLAAVITLVVLGLHGTYQRKAWYALAGLAVLLGALAVIRNQDYRSELAIWKDSIAKRPDNSRGQYNLAKELAKNPQRVLEAIEHYQQALRIQPALWPAHNNLAALLVLFPGRQTEAITHYEAALRLKPDLAVAHNNLGLELAKIPGRQAEAMAHYEAALRNMPDDAEAHFNLAISLTPMPGRIPDAIAHYEQALRLRPDFAEAHNNLALLLANIPRRRAEAIAHYEAALRLRPDWAVTHHNLATVLASLGRLDEAASHLEAALTLNPAYASARENLKKIRAQQGGRK